MKVDIMDAIDDVLEWNDDVLQENSRIEHDLPFFPQNSTEAVELLFDQQSLCVSPVPIGNALHMWMNQGVCFTWIGGCQDGCGCMTYERSYDLRYEPVEAFEGWGLIPGDKCEILEFGSWYHHPMRSCPHLIANYWSAGETLAAADRAYRVYPSTPIGDYLTYAAAFVGRDERPVPYPGWLFDHENPSYDYDRNV